ncbi:UbiA family prenyltransferase [Rhodobacterales bacterium HKCCE3408]|nr:UbiA family prenyltransferase [Rhodobacterales bacterium HKCCE3408]
MSFDDAESGRAGDRLVPAAQGEVLAVDLDGTLLNGDLLYESFWAGLARDWRTPLRAAVALSDGRAQLKRVLAESASLDAASLNFNDAVVDRVRAWTEAGGKAILVTASDQTLADEIAAHLGLFDAAHGSDGTTNLKGARKAEFLAGEFGQGGFVYMGDSASDLAVWRQSRAAIGVGLSPAVRRELSAMGRPVEQIAGPALRPAVLLEALRPHQWLKNLLVFVPMVADQRYDTETFVATLLAFIAMSCVASAGYVLNDMLDLADDRTHPRKRDRPLASGRLALQTGTMLLPALLVAGMAAALADSIALAGIIAIYFILTTAYSVKLKRFALVDVFLLAVLYTSRIVAGAVAIWVEPSIWLLAFSMFFFLSLAGVKRQAELTEAETEGARSTTRRGYRLVDRATVTQMSVAAGYAAVLVLALYLNDPDVQARYSAPRILWLVCPVLLYWVSSMVLTAGRGEMHDDPLIYAFRNRQSRGVLACFALLVVLASTL